MSVELSRQAGQQRAVDTAFAVEVTAGLVVGARPAVGDVDPNARAAGGEFADLARQRVVTAVARAVDEPDRALAGRGITRVLSYMIAPEVAQGRLEILLEDHEPPAAPIHVLHKEPGRTSARVRAVVDHLVEQLRANPALGR